MLTLNIFYENIDDTDILNEISKTLYSKKNTIQTDYIIIIYSYVYILCIIIIYNIMNVII